MDFDDQLSATVGFASGTGTVTETVTFPHGSRSVTFTQESGNSGLYQLNGDTHQTFAFSGIGTNSVTETVTGTDATTTLTYSQTATAGQYSLTADSKTFTGASDVTYGFTQSNGTVSAISVTATGNNWTWTHNLPIVPDAQFTIGSSTITETLASGNKVDTLTFTAGTGGAYSLTSIATNWVAQGSATTALDIDAFDRAQFTISGGAVTAVARVNPDGSTSSVASDSHVVFSVPAAGFVEETVTLGSHSYSKLFYSASGGGTYTAVAEVSGSAVDLVGLKAQIAELPSGVAALL